MHRFLPDGDRQLIQIVDAALADATRRSGSWLVCRPGCTQCCVGVFAISPLDALRLQQGLIELEADDPQRAARVRSRATESVARLTPDYPGNPKTGILDPDSEECFAAFANDEPCPALDPSSGTCELCFHGATEEQIAACEMIGDPDDLESNLLREMEQKSALTGDTIVAFALAEK